MAISRQKKETSLKNLEESLAKMKSLVLIDYYGLKVKEINELRKNLKAAGCQYVVTKKTLLRKALEKIGSNVIDLKKIIGGIGLVLGLEDEISPIKTVATFSKNHEKMKIQGGVFNQTFVDLTQLKQLAALPSREQLLTQVVWTIKAPIQNLVSAMHGNLRKLVYAFSAIAEKKHEFHE